MKPILVLAAAGVGALAVRPHPGLIWNTTASAPVGLYQLQADPPPRVGDLVVVRPPRDLAAWLAARGYAPLGVPLMKRWVATGPSIACRRTLTVTVDGEPVGLALPRGQRGEPLPRWNGCVRLRPDQVFLLNPPRGSLDSRYFGPLPRSSILGRAVPLWTGSAP